MSRMSKCASNVIRPSLVELAAKPEQRRPGYRIVAAGEQRQRMRFGARCEGVADQWRRLLDGQPGKLDVAPVRDQG